MDDCEQSGRTCGGTRFYDEDVIFMTPGRARFGKGEFAANAERMKDFTMKGRHELQEIEILGNHAYIRNYLEITLRKAGDTPKRMSGYTMGILPKESDGRWRLAGARIY